MFRINKSTIDWKCIYKLLNYFIVYSKSRNGGRELIPQKFHRLSKIEKLKGKQSTNFNNQYHYLAVNLIPINMTIFPKQKH